MDNKQEPVSQPIQNKEEWKLDVKAKLKERWIQMMVEDGLMTAEMAAERFDVLDQEAEEEMRKKMKPKSKPLDFARRYEKRKK